MVFTAQNENVNDVFFLLQLFTLTRRKEDGMRPCGDFFAREAYKPPDI